MSRTIGDTNTWDVSVGQRAHRFTDNSLSLKVKTAMKMIGTNFSEITAQSQCKVKWRNKSSLLHILWMSLNAAGKHQSNYILFHVVCLKMESLQKYIIPAISENRKMDFIPACHGSFTTPSSHTKNTFRSSIFHLLECISLIVRCIDWWKMRFLCHLSSTPIFHLPPAVLGNILVLTIWKTNGYIQFLIRLSL